MSARNGDKSRFGRQRKRKIAKRLQMRELGGQSKAAAPASEKPAEQHPS